MKKAYLLLLLLCVTGIAGYGQTAASYLFSRSTGTYTSISGDAGATAITSGGMISDDGTTTGIPIGFVFYFSGTPYTTLSANANGFISLSGIITSNVDGVFTPEAANIGGAGTLMPFWDDLYGTASTAYYETTGTPGSRVFTLEYNNWGLCCSSGIASLYFQVKLYEGTGMVQFVYGSSSGSPTDAAIGIGNSSTDYQSLPLTTSTTTDSTTFSNSDSLPASGTVLQWCPAGAITGTASVCVGFNTTLSSVYTGGVWSSNDNTIATVGSSSGIVTGVAAGTVNITYTPACGNPGVAQVTVNPIPDVAGVTGQTICNSANSSAIPFTGTYSGTTFNWTDDNPSIGIGTSSGSGDIGVFTATNGGTTPISSTFTVTPTRNGCTGSSINFTITVNPTPDVFPSTNQTLCNGTMTTAVIFSGSVSGTTFSWTNTNTSIGLAASGTGDTLGAFSAIDTSVTSSVTSVITVNTTANGCTGGSNTFTIMVNPTPVLTSSQTPPAICNGTMFSYTPTASTGGGTTFAWSRAAVAGISNVAGSGTGDPAEVLTDTTGNPDQETVVYTYAIQSPAGCVDTQNVSVVVNPTPMLSSTLFPSPICDSTLFTYIPTSATTGTTFTWSRAAVTGISNPAASGADTIMETLWNSTPYLDTVWYVDTLVANGCSNTQMIRVVVNPRPTLSTATTIAPVCDTSMLMYVPGSLTPGTTFTWFRPAIPGGNPAASGADTIMESLIDTSANPIVVVYYDTLTAYGCTNVQTITTTVNPIPMLSSSLSPAGVCDSALFDYTPTSRTVGATYMWNRPFVVGIGNVAESGSGVISDYLKNNTNDNLTVTYVFTVTANGCSNVQDVNLVVHPTPTLSSDLAPTLCSGNNFGYVPTSYVFGTTFAWHRNSTTGITPTTESGSGVRVNDTLTNGGSTPLAAVYVFTLTANGCTHVEDLTLTVNPSPVSIPITTYPPSSVCDNTMYQNFGVASVPPAGQQYHWTATNATVWATGANKQYCLVNFDHPGTTAVITLQSNFNGFGCSTLNSYYVNVGTSSSDFPQVIYFQGGAANPIGQFICLQADEDNYQWGYDDATTLDSTVISGENNPNYINSAPDLTHRYYWVITNKNGCMQKTYYNAPTAISNVNAGESASLKVFPNPAKEVLNVDINTTVEGKYELDVVNMLGQKLGSSEAVNNKAAIDVAGLPSGCYLVDCYRNGVKVAAVRFIKN